MRELALYLPGQHTRAEPVGGVTGELALEV